MLPSEGQAKARGTLTLKLPIEEDTRDRLSKLQSRGKDMEKAWSERVTERGALRCHSRLQVFPLLPAGM